MSKFAVNLAISVAWGEMDAFGHVNNVVYFRYFESARIAYFQAVLDREVKSSDFLPILASADYQYLKPVVFPDTLEVGARVTKIGKSSLTMEYGILSTAQSALVATGTAVVVNIDSQSGRSLAISDSLRQQIASLENNPSFLDH